MTGLEAAAILLMAGLTFLTRIAGPLVVDAMPATPGGERFLIKLSGAVLAAIAALAALGGDLARGTGVATAAMTMLATRRPSLALAVGAAVTAAMRL